MPLYFYLNGLLFGYFYFTSVFELSVCNNSIKMDTKFKLFNWL